MWYEWITSAYLDRLCTGRFRDLREVQVVRVETELEKHSQQGLVKDGNHLEGGRDRWQLKTDQKVVGVCGPMHPLGCGLNQGQWSKSRPNPKVNGSQLFIDRWGVNSLFSSHRPTSSIRLVSEQVLVMLWILTIVPSSYASRRTGYSGTRPACPAVFLVRRWVGLYRFL